MCVANISGLEEERLIEVCHWLCQCFFSLYNQGYREHLLAMYD
jgi:hypothetical protein